MTELLVSTKKGLFVLEGEPGAGFGVKARAFAGEPVEYALRDLRSGRVLATTTSPFYGPKIFYTDDPAGEWVQAQGVALPCAYSIAPWPGEPDRLVVGAGPRSGTGCRRSTPTSRSCVRRSPRSARALVSACTSGPPRVTCSPPRTPARAGPPPRPGCHRCSRSPRADRPVAASRVKPAGQPRDDGRDPRTIVPSTLGQFGGVGR